MKETLKLTHKKSSHFLKSGKGANYGLMRK